MASPYWIKLYHKMLNDPQIAQLSDRLWRRWVECILYSADTDSDGELPSVDDMSYRLHLKPEELETDLVELARVGVIEQIAGVWVIPNFKKYQYSSSTMRVRKHRAKKKEEESLREKYGDPLGV